MKQSPNIWISIVFALYSSLLMAQEEPVETIELKGVEVQAQRIFLKEYAGMKHTAVDSMVLVRKINLSLSDVLSENTAVFIKNHGRGALSTASFRGTAPSHTQLIWNGININNPMTGMVDFSVIPIYVTDELVLQHGSSSLKNGSGGLGGSISMNNRPDWKQGFSMQYIQGIGSYKTLEEYFSLSWGTRGFQLRTRAYHNQSANNYTYINRGLVEQESGKLIHPVDTHRNADYLNYGFLQEMYLQVSSSQTLSARWWSHWSDRSIPKVSSYEGPDYNNLNNQWDIDHRFSMDWNYYLSEGKIMLLVAGADNSLDYMQQNYVGGRGLIPVVNSESKQRVWYQKVLAQHQFSENWSWEATVSHKSDDVFSADSVLQRNFEGQRSEFSSMFNLSGRLFRKMNANLILRQNITDGDISPLMPFLGVDIKPFDDIETVWKASAARNHHYPTLNDLYRQPGGNPDLMPEEALTFETGIQHRMRFLPVAEAEISYFYSDVENWIIWIPSIKGFWEPKNIKKVISRGMEGQIRIGGNFGTIGYKVLLNYAYTRAENYGDPVVWGDESYGKQLVYIPVHSGNAFFQVAYKNWKLYWQHNSYSERFTTTSNQISRRDWLYPYYMNDAGLSRDFELRNFQISAEVKVYNVLNETYHSILYRPMPGRNFMFMLKLGF